MNEPLPRRRGRPPGYDRDRALADAGDAFWQGGYAATTLEKLADAMGMNRPSVHAAFGDKRAIYLEAFDRYARASEGRVATLLATDEPLAAQLTRVYDAAIALYLKDDDAPRGCFLVGTALAEATGDVAIRDRLRTALESIDAAYAARFSRAQAAGEIAAHVDPATLGHWAGAMLNALAVRARAGTPRDTLEGIARQTVTALCAG